MSPQTLTPTETTPEVQSNQTHFAEEEPIFEETSLPKSATRPGEEKAVKPGISPAVIVLTVLLIMMALGVATLFFLPQSTPQVVVQEPSPTPSPIAQETGIQDRLSELNTDLQSADPTKLNLPFPPVDMKLSIDPLPQN